MTYLRRNSNQEEVLRIWIRRWLKEYFALNKTVNPHLISSSGWKYVFYVSLDKGGIYCKFTSNLVKASAESTALKMLEGIGSDLVPSLLEYQDVDVCGEWKSLAISALRGSPIFPQISLIPLLDLKKIWRSAGRLLRSIHNVSFSSYGVLGETPEKNFSCWRDCLVDTVQLQALEFLKSRRSPYNSLVKQGLNWILANMYNLPNDNLSSSLIHRDFQSRNIIVEQRNKCWHISGVVDFEHAYRGHPEFDFARLWMRDFYKYPDLECEFFEGYFGNEGFPPGFLWRRKLHCIAFGIGSMNYSLKHQDWNYLNEAFGLLKRAIRWQEKL